MSLNILFIILVTSIYKVTSECNGSPLLCNRSYSDITHLVTHDSYAIMPNIAATQDMTIIQQLDDGVRGIKLSAVSESELRLCHSYCHVLDAGTVIDTLNSIAEWLESNPKEVVTIMWNNLYQYNVNSIADAYLDSNIMPYVFTHKLLDSWPTLQQMIDSGHRLVNFVDMQSNETSHPW